MEVPHPRCAGLERWLVPKLLEDGARLEVGAVVPANCYLLIEVTR